MSSQQHVHDMWVQQRGDELNDSLLVVLRSPENPHNYLAFGERRLYWYDSKGAEGASGNASDDEEDELTPPLSRDEVCISVPALHLRPLSPCIIDSSTTAVAGARPPRASMGP